jgi:hypothetical protein
MKASNQSKSLRVRLSKIADISSNYDCGMMNDE